MDTLRAAVDYIQALRRLVGENVDGEDLGNAPQVRLLSLGLSFGNLNFEIHKSSSKDKIYHNNIRQRLCESGITNCKLKRVHEGIKSQIQTLKPQTTKSVY